MLAQVEAIANCPLPALQASDEIHFAQCIRTMSLLPSRPDDEIGAKLRISLYRRHFGHLPREQINFLAEQATLTCRFFPTPVECAEIIARWKRGDDAIRARDFARSRFRSELQFRFDEVMQRLSERALPQVEIDGLPDRVKRIAEERGYLRFVDGEFVVRHEPQRPAEAA